MGSDGEEERGERKVRHVRRKNSCCGGGFTTPQPKGRETISIRGTGQAHEWLDKLDRIGNRDHLTLILSVLATVKDDVSRVAVFKALERHIFAGRLLNYPYYVYYGRGESFLQEAILLYRGKIDAKAVVQKINEVTTRILENPRYLLEVRQRFRSNGFYAWPLIRYFLFEYNLDMQIRSKTQRAKIDWSIFAEDRDDHASVEHIFPQRARDEYWRNRFGGFSSKQISLLRNSLGNLLPLSKPKNSSLSNGSFNEKIDGRSGQFVGYRYGSYAENEVTKETEWTAAAIRRRGLRMLSFLERRWNIKLGPDEDKLIMLGVDFVKEHDH